MSLHGNQLDDSLDCEQTARSGVFCILSCSLPRPTTSVPPHRSTIAR